ncbi:hypothetical protein [Bacillus sp. MRMR6]|uniref:hypothetical protein n=1 Tax=Bacillus sp. MRMR6 TaxID=1928617 RepID=UPI000950F21E|nr:hypothetical protein [Bacillus sp. MRMR6]OLS33886.1 hypothetical protein BTR25_23800 [Bacillus sp. MRMR6]
MRRKERRKLKNAVLSRHSKRASLKASSSAGLRAQLLATRNAKLINGMIDFDKIEINMNDVPDLGEDGLMILRPESNKIHRKWLED